MPGGTTEGVRAGDYRVQAVKIDGDRASVALKLNTEAVRTYTLIRDGDRWLVDGLDEKQVVQRAKLGEPLRYAESFELNGQAIDARLTVTVLKVEPVTAPEFQEPRLGQWLRMMARVKSESSGELDVSTPDLQLVTENGQRYMAVGYAFEPSLGNEVTHLSPGETLTGFASLDVPKSVEAKEVRFLPAGSEHAPLVWELG